MNIEELKKHIGTKIKEYRRVNNLTTVELGRLSNTSQTTISSIERGMRFGTFESMLNICDVLGISLYDILPQDYTQRVNLNNVNEDKQLQILIENLSEREIHTVKNLILDDLPLLEILGQLDSKEKKHLKELFNSILNNR
ncbi:helix-turn-helix domain-containing protein [Priestia filamentosa]|uniref:helix-turn-helix domain-containing protein n=1 Tax=Priestia filamentosa TaxID=1402861 RepID=UPI0028954C21|nr:helix-turn-helix transcriptional regulator [Priestia filamentosa]MDT3766168.1 helix-turn-helix transcriptional regulator [Priestia filamentosa]